MSRSNPFAPPDGAPPRQRRARRAPDHPPVVRRVRRLGLSMPLEVQAEIYRRWEAMDDAERFESIDAEAALTDEELRTGWGELLDDIAEAKREGRPLTDVRSDG